MVVKSFITLAPGCSVIRLFSSSLMTTTNKLEHLSLAILFILVYYLWVTPEVYLREMHLYFCQCYKIL
jgi:hypothetical protein